MKRLALVLFLTMNPLLSKANDDTCRRVNLQKDSWGDLTYKNMPIYKQRMGICYAYAGVQMIDYWRRSKMITKSMRSLMGMKDIPLSSPQYAAYVSRKESFANYGYKEDKRNIEGGQIAEVITAVKKWGMCREDIIYRSIQQLADKVGIRPDMIIKFSHGLLETYNEYRVKNRSFWRFFGFKQKGMVNKFYKNYLEKEGCGNNSEMKESPECYAYEEVLYKLRPLLEENDYLGFLDYVFQSCENENGKYPFTAKLPEPKVYETVFSSKYIKKLKKLLNKKDAQPVGIGYCARFLRDKNYIGLDRLGKVNDPKCGPHASIVIGMRKREGKCQFLIRNTWGKKCPYDWDCEYTRGAKRTRGHGVWVDEDALRKNLMELTWLE